MRVDTERALAMLREANPVPDARSHREEFGSLGKPAPELLTARPPTGRPPHRYRWAAALAAGAVIVVLGVLGPLTSRFGNSAQAPFDNPVAAVPAVVAAFDAADREAQARVLQPLASVDLFGHTRTVDNQVLQRELAFGAGIGRRHLVEDCWQVDQRGYCRMLYHDDLMAEAGLTPFPDEWSVTLGPDGLVATVRAMSLDSPELDLVQDWFMEFNRWLCHNEPEAARLALWDPLVITEEYEEPDCASTEWQWVGDQGDPEEARRLHELYLTDR